MHTFVRRRIRADDVAARINAMLTRACLRLAQRLAQLNIVLYPCRRRARQRTPNHSYFVPDAYTAQTPALPTFAYDSLPGATTCGRKYASPLKPAAQARDLSYPVHTFFLPVLKTSVIACNACTRGARLLSGQRIGRSPLSPGRRSPSVALRFGMSWYGRQYIL